MEVTLLVVLAAFFALQASDFLQADDGLRGWALAACAMACFAGGLRYVILIWLKN